MLSKVAQILSVTLVLCNTAMAGDGRFTLVPSGGSVPFQATCFDDIATAKLLTWREFQETEFENRLRFELDLQSEKYTLELESLEIKLNETIFRYDQKILLRDKEIESLRTIIKKDRKVHPKSIYSSTVSPSIILTILHLYSYIERSLKNFDVSLLGETQPLDHIP